MIEAFSYKKIYYYAKCFHGLGIALITPFKDDGSVDYDALVNLVKYQLDNGADFFCKNVERLASVAACSEYLSMKAWSRPAFLNFSFDFAFSKIALFCFLYWPKIFESGFILFFSA